MYVAVAQEDEENSVSLGVRARKLANSYCASLQASTTN
jgi:hypothetical protein